MEKLRKIFRKIRRYYRKKKLYNMAESDARILCGTHFSMLPPEIYIEGDKDTMLRETRRILYSTKIEHGEFRIELADGTTIEPTLENALMGM